MNFLTDCHCPESGLVAGVSLPLVGSRKALPSEAARSGFALLAPRLFGSLNLSPFPFSERFAAFRPQKEFFNPP